MDGAASAQDNAKIVCLLVDDEPTSTSCDASRMRTTAKAAAPLKRDDD